jgi:uncharacterized protein YbjQ (UPF0145 family)
MPELIIFLILLLLGYGFGRFIEKRHYRSIISREQELQDLPAIATKEMPLGENYSETRLVSGNVVVSVDYFKRIMAGLANLVGGRVTAYETLIDRARRGAILRMKQAARDMGADMVFNIKIDTSSVFRGHRRNAVGSVEVFAYGTALIR